MAAEVTSTLVPIPQEGTDAVERVIRGAQFLAKRGSDGDAGPSAASETEGRTGQQRAPSAPAWENSSGDFSLSLLDKEMAQMMFLLCSTTPHGQDATLNRNWEMMANMMYLLDHYEKTLSASLQMVRLYHKTLAHCWSHMVFILLKENVTAQRNVIRGERRKNPASCLKDDALSIYERFYQRCLAQHNAALLGENGIDALQASMKRVVALREGAARRNVPSLPLILSISKQVQHFVLTRVVSAAAPTPAASVEAPSPAEAAPATPATPQTPSLRSGSLRRSPLATPSLLQPARAAAAESVLPPSRDARE